MKNYKNEIVYLHNGWFIPICVNQPYKRQQIPPSSFNNFMSPPVSFFNNVIPAPQSPFLNDIISPPTPKDRQPTLHGMPKQIPSIPNYPSEQPPHFLNNIMPPPNYPSKQPLSISYIPNYPPLVPQPMPTDIPQPHDISIPSFPQEYSPPVEIPLLPLFPQEYSPPISFVPIYPPKYSQNKLPILVYPLENSHNPPLLSVPLHPKESSPPFQNISTSYNNNIKFELGLGLGLGLGIGLTIFGIIGIYIKKQNLTIYKFLRYDPTINP